MSEIWSKMYIGVHVQYLLFLSDCNEPWIFLTFLENTQISNLMKIHPVGAELFHTDRWVDERTDMIKPIVIYTILQMCLKMTLASRICNSHESFINITAARVWPCIAHMSESLHICSSVRCEHTFHWSWTTAIYSTEQHALLLLRISYIFSLGHCISTQYTKFSVDYYQPFFTNKQSVKH